MIWALDEGKHRLTAHRVWFSTADVFVDDRRLAAFRLDSCRCLCGKENQEVGKLSNVVLGQMFLIVKYDKFCMGRIVGYVTKALEIFAWFTALKFWHKTHDATNQQSPQQMFATR